VLDLAICIWRAQNHLLERFGGAISGTLVRNLKKGGKKKRYLFWGGRMIKEIRKVKSSLVLNGDHSGTVSLREWLS